MDNIKRLTFRMPRDLWLFYKSLAAENDLQLTTIMLNVLKKYKKKYEKVLTIKDTTV